jgi:propanol-preferring alcohol dehydrogenase
MFLGDREAVVVDKPDPVPGPGHAVVRMVRAAVCGSDLHGYRRARSAGSPPQLVPGHEPVGIVEAVGSGVDPAVIGQRVMVYHRPGCNVCPQCLAGCSNICSGNARPRMDGSDADLYRCYADRLFPIPDAMDWETAVVISCQAGTAYAPLARVGASGRTTVVVSGLGPVGLCAVMIGRAMGATIIGIDPMAERRALAASFGAAAVIDPALGDAAIQVRDLLPDGAEAVIETSGNPAAQLAAIEALRVEGTAAMVGLGSQQPSIAPALMFGRQLGVYSSNLYPQRMVPEIFDFVQQRAVPLASIITHRFPIEAAPEAFRLADTATTGKVVFAWDDAS